MQKAKLWIGTAGEITCENHAGSYLRAEIANDPNATQHITPLDWWIVYTSGGYDCETCAKVSA
jgi:hypothetical protein